MQFALRDREITTLAICGIALEIGIEPTIRHAADLGIYLFLSQALAVQATKKQDSAPSISFASWRRLDRSIATIAPRPTPITWGAAVIIHNPRPVRHSTCEWRVPAMPPPSPRQPLAPQPSATLKMTDVSEEGT